MAFFSAYFVTQGVLQVGVGILADRFGRDLAIGICMTTGIVGFLLLVAGPGLVPIVTGTLLFSVGMGWGAAVFPRFMDLFGWSVSLGFLTPCLDSSARSFSPIMSSVSATERVISVASDALE